MLHLDHGRTLQDILRAIQAGFTSVMFDGSELPYEENIRQTKAVVDLAHLVGVSVEGEVGTIGIMNYSDEGGVDHITYTRPEEVVDFTAKTGVDSLAVAIGTSHGLYPEGFVPKLQLDLLRELKQVSPVPLVLHGGSDNPDEEIRQACQIGIRKVNIASDYKAAYSRKLNEIMNETGEFKFSTLMPKGFEAARGHPAQDGIVRQRRQSVCLLGETSMKKDGDHPYQCRVAAGSDDLVSRDHAGGGNHQHHRRQFVSGGQAEQRDHPAVISRMCRYVQSAESLGVDLIFNQCSSVGGSLCDRQPVYGDSHAEGR